MRPQALRALRACAHIIDAGDIGDVAGAGVQARLLTPRFR